MLIRTRSLLGILTVSLFTITSCLPPDQHNLDATTTNLEGDPAQEHCGFDVAEEPEGPYTDPCSDGVLILEPETFTRSKGKPQVHTKSFSVTEPGGICVLVHNCKTSAAWIGVDGFAMINPDKFNSHVSAVSATMNVAQGEHELSVRMASSPGSEITVEIRFAPVDVTPRGKVVGDNGGVSVWNLFDVPDPFSPRDVNEVKDVSTLSAMVGVLHFSGGSGFLYKLRYTFQIADSMECKQIRSVSNELVVDPTTRLEGFPVLAEWDGSTDEGIMVSDGVYFYRVVVELLRYNEDGNPVTIDRAESMIQTITVDNEPPTIGLISLIASNNGMVVLDSYTTDPLSIEGGIYDDNGVASSSLTYDGQLIAIPSEGLFNIDADMPPVIGLDFFDHKLLVFAVDHAGNEASFNVRLRLYAQHNTHRLIVRFNPYTSTLSNKSILEEIGGRIVYSDLLNRLYLIEIDPVEPIYKTANRLSNLSEVAYAIPDSPNFDNQPNDYYYGRVYSQAADNSVATSLSSWHLFNDGTGYSGRSQGYCLTDANCGWSQSCVLDGCNGFHCCQCQLGTVPEQCPAGQHCVATASGYNVCVVDAVFDADIGWLDVYDDIMGLVGNEPVVVGICEANGIFQLDHQDIVQNLYTNEIECCSSPPCNLPCTLGEVIPDRNCNSDADCDDGHSCLVVPSHGSCMDGSECNIGKHCLTNDDCGINGRCHTIDGNRICIAGFTNVVGRLCFTDSQCGIDYPGCNTFEGRCGAILPTISRCTDGYPGARGFDDDGDGYTDFADPDVMNLVSTLASNGIDDDADGEIDEDDEKALAAWDDDENGYIDDMHGVDLYSHAFRGPLFGNTQINSLVRSSGHATTVAGVAGATVNNGLDIAGIHPSVRIVSVGVGDSSLMPSAFRYLASVGARVVNMSFQSSDIDRNKGFDFDYEYYNAIDNVTKLYRDNLDPNTTYVLSAGNMRRNLDTIKYLPPEGEGKFQAPQNVDIDSFLVVSSTNILDGFADYWLGCDSTYCRNIFPGSSYGENTVDVGAPGDLFLTLSDPNAGYLDNVYLASGTSFSAPLVSAFVALLHSKFPVFENNPQFTIQRIGESGDHIIDKTVNGVQVPGLEGRTKYGTRVDLNGAFNAALPPVPQYMNESYRLNDYKYNNTHDIDFADADDNGLIDFYIEVFGGPFVDNIKPRLHIYDISSNEFRDESFRLPDLAGNYNKVDIADLNGDGCMDIVFAGFFQQDPDPSAAEGDLAGAPNRLLFQIKEGNVCLELFSEVTDNAVDGDMGDVMMPVRNDISRDVDAFDYDGDGDVDILFTNAHMPWYPGGTFGQQLLTNRLAEEGIVYFVDESWRIVDGYIDSHRSATKSCDVNNDGLPDIVMAVNAGSDGRNRVFLNVVPLQGGPHAGEHLFMNVSVLAFPIGTGFSHDVACHDFMNKDGDMIPDGFPELVFARRYQSTNLFFINKGNDVDGSWLGMEEANDLIEEKLDTTQEVEICDLDGDGIAEILFGNGDIETWKSEPNRVLEFNNSTGTFVDTERFGFRFESISDLTEDIECVNLDGDVSGSIDAVIIGNTGGRNWLYVRQW